MSEFSTTEILLFLFGSGGTIAGLVAVGKAVFERLDARRKEKKDEEKTHTSLAIESRRLDMTENEQLRDEWRVIVEEKKKEIEGLKLEINHFKDVLQQHDATNSLSRGAARRLRKQINLVDKLIDEANCEHQVKDLRDEMDKLRLVFDELESQLP